MRRKVSCPSSSIEAAEKEPADASLIRGSRYCLDLPLSSLIVEYCGKFKEGNAMLCTLHACANPRGYVSYDFDYRTTTVLVFLFYSIYITSYY